MAVGFLTRRCAYAILAGFWVPAPSGHAQLGGIPPRVGAARAITVDVRASFSHGASDGTGIIIGRRADSLIVATARHVVMDYDVLADSISIELFAVQGRPHRAQFLPCSTDLDIGFVSAPLAGPGYVELDGKAFARMPRSPVQEREAVYAIGNNWKIPPPGLLGRGSEGYIDLQSAYLTEGYSGGGIFTRRGDLIGLASRGDSPNRKIIAIDSVIAAAERCGVQVLLTRSPPDYSTYIRVGAMFGLVHTTTAGGVQPTRDSPAVTATLEHGQGLSSYAAMARGMRVSMGNNAQIIGFNYGARFFRGWGAGTTLGIEWGRRRTDQESVWQEVISLSVGLDVGPELGKVGETLVEVVVEGRIAREIVLAGAQDYYDLSIGLATRRGR